MMFRPDRCCVVIVATAILHNIMYRPETACTKSTMQPATVTMIRGGEGDDRQPNNLSSTDAKQFNCVFCDTSMTFCTHLGVVHNCHHFHERTQRTLFCDPLPKAYFENVDSKWPWS